jgi:hypothetical protein
MLATGLLVPLFGARRATGGFRFPPRWSWFVGCLFGAGQAGFYLFSSVNVAFVDYWARSLEESRSRWLEATYRSSGKWLRLDRLYAFPLRSLVSPKLGFVSAALLPVVIFSHKNGSIGTAIVALGFTWFGVRLPVTLARAWHEDQGGGAKESFLVGYRPSRRVGTDSGLWPTRPSVGVTFLRNLFPAAMLFVIASKLDTAASLFDKHDGAALLETRLTALSHQWIWRGLLYAFAFSFAFSMVRFAASNSGVTEDGISKIRGEIFSATKFVVVFQLILAAGGISLVVARSKFGWATASSVVVGAALTVGIVPLALAARLQVRSSDV